MELADSYTRIKPDRYREMAGEIRSLIAMLKCPEATPDLNILAARYESLADRVEQLARSRSLRA